MAEMTVQFRSIADTDAAIGWASGHSIVVDRPDGKAGGHGLGFNGGQLLAMAIGGCMCNDLHYVAHAAGVRLSKVEVEVTVTFEGDPLLATGATMTVAAEAEDDTTDVAAIIEKAKATSTVSNSVQRGLPVTVSSKAR